MYEHLADKSLAKQDSTLTKGLLSHLLETRRQKFKYVDRSKDGSLKSGAWWVFVLNTLASCSGIPVLFFISFHVLQIYTAIDIVVGDLLSVMFVACAMSLFLDILIGYLFDRLVKTDRNKLKKVLVILGTIGLVISIAYLFRPDPTPREATIQFRWTILAISVCYTLTNLTPFKNSANYTPSQNHRGLLIYGEYCFKALVILLFICIPYWVKSGSSDCSCGDICRNDAGSNECFTCINNCDSFQNSDIFKTISIIFTCIFGLANILNELIVNCRTDDKEEQMPTSINRRIVELTRNGLVVKSFFSAIFQYALLFGVAFWINFYLNTKSRPEESCTSSWGNAIYFCSNSWLKQLSVILILAISFIFWLILLKKKIFRFLSTELNLIMLVSGVLFTIIGNNDTVAYVFIIVFFAFFYNTLAGNKLLYTGGMFYDEYWANSTQNYLTSAFYNLAIKIGFFLSLAFHFTLIDEEIRDPSHPNIDGKAFGGLTIFLVILIYILNFFIQRYDISAFDKVQVAIERNRGDVIIEDLHFYDPLAKKVFRRPIVSHDPQERRLISLVYNFDPRDDLKLAVDGKLQLLQSNASLRGLLFVVAFIVFLVIEIIFGEYLETNYGWLVFIGLLILPISFYGALYNYNAWRSAIALEEAKNKDYERAVTSRFIIFTLPNV